MDGSLGFTQSRKSRSRNFPRMSLAKGRPVTAIILQLSIMLDGLWTREIIEKMSVQTLVVKLAGILFPLVILSHKRLIQNKPSSYGTPQSLPSFQHPSHGLLKENGFTQLQYSKYHSRCLKGTN